jgi:integrase/recombinase XerD
MKTPVQMYLRLPDGTYPYLRAAYASNGHIRPNHAVHKGRAANFPGSTYYLRYQINGKRVWEPAGDESSLALVALQRKALALQDAEEP